MKAFLTPVFALLLLAAPMLRAESAPHNTVTIAPWAKAYSANGGQMTISVTMNYSGAVTVPGVSLVAPKGWSFVSVGGANAPTVAPKFGDEGEMGFTYLEGGPASLASFTVTLAYPAGLTGPQTFSSVYAVFRPEQPQVTQADFVISPAAGEAHRGPVEK